MPTDFKPLIVREFETVRLADLSEGRKFQAIAYSKFLAKLKTIDAIHSFEDVAEVAGKGKIADKVREIIETGALGAAQRARESTDVEAYDALLKVYGVGPVKAKALIAAGVTSIDELRARVAAEPGLLTDAQKVGLEYYEDILERIPRAEMEQHEQVVIDNCDPVLMDVTVVGSYRRGAADSGDIDVLISMPSSLKPAVIAQHFSEYVDRLIEMGYIEAVLAQGPTKCLAVCRLPDIDGQEGKARRLDLLMIPRDQYAYAILYFTGSDRFNVAMRGWALEKGYTMNEHRLTPVREGVPEAPPMAREQDIFYFLGLKWVPPTSRVDGDQVVAAGRIVLGRKAKTE
jgi:DNA polymerase/3'-5' exonuclease PolX